MPENERLSNTMLTRNRGWTYALWKGKQFLLPPLSLVMLSLLQTG